jgi:Mg-chelatase subunit ChlD
LTPELILVLEQEPITITLSLRDEIKVKVYEKLYPGSLVETTIINCWMGNIPLIPVGMPYNFNNRCYPENEIIKNKITSIYEEFDKRLAGVKNWQEMERLSITMASRLWKKISELGKKGRSWFSESCYIASRLAELKRAATTADKKLKTLVIVDLKHYTDLKQLVEIIDEKSEMYHSPKPEPKISKVNILTKEEKGLDYLEQEKFDTTLAQNLFKQELKRWYWEKAGEELSLKDVKNYVISIVRKTRYYPGVTQGVSVRGTLAFEKLVNSFAEISGKLNRICVEKAALVALPPRIKLDSAYNRSKTKVVNSLIYEVIYDLGKKDYFPSKALEKPTLSKEDFKEAIKGLFETTLCKEHKKKGLIQNNRTFSNLAKKNRKLKGILSKYGNISENPQKLLYILYEQLEEGGFLAQERKGYSFTEKAIKELNKELEEKLRQGALSNEEYTLEKKELGKIKEKQRNSKNYLSKENLTEVIGELIDLETKTGKKDIGIDDVYTNYVVKKNKGEFVDPEKLDYKKVQMIVSELKKKGFLKQTKYGMEGFTLTSKALIWLLDELISQNSKKLHLKTAYSDPNSDREAVDIFRFKRGDLFRDISIRHSIREIIKQKKKLEDVKKKDLRVIEKRLKQNLDIILCLDVSSSMKEKSKLRFTKLAAAGLSRASLLKNYRIGVVSFSNAASVITPLTDKLAPILNSLIRLRTEEYTNIADGIKCARELLIREKGPQQRQIILITDGKANSVSKSVFKDKDVGKKENIGANHTIKEARKIAFKDIKISVLLLTDRDNGSEKFCKKIAKLGNGQFYKIITPENLPIRAMQMIQR